MSSDSVDLFPPQTPAYILSFQFSSWYPSFSDVSIKSTIIRPLSTEFREYLESDSVFVPIGSEDIPAESTLSDDEDEDDNNAGDDDEDVRPSYSFPDLDARIRDCVKQYDAVFPKLNFTAPRDAAWLLPAGSPLKCTSPADVYLLLKSSDFVNHDMTPDSVFESCEEGDREEPTTSDIPSSSESADTPKTVSGSAAPSVPARPHYELELVLRKWYAVNPSREVRCFVRNGRLIGISQRDTNHYDFLSDPSTQNEIVNNTTTFWEQKIKPKMSQKDYIFDVLLTRDLSRGHIIDFNSYSPRTDSLLFSYEELRDLAAIASAEGEMIIFPEFRCIDSPSHPAANRNAPVHQHNMVPYEAVHLSSGQDIDGFAQLWKEQLNEAVS